MRTEHDLLAAQKEDALFDPIRERGGFGCHFLFHR
jgi:hypothetical protein